MNADQLFLAALDSATLAMSMLNPSVYNDPTPDTEWDVRTLANHMLYELFWTADVVRGRTISEVGSRYEGDLVGNDPRASWHRAKVAATKAVKNCDLGATIHLSWRDSTNDYYLNQAAADQLIHSWDLSAALLKPVKFEEDVAQAVYDKSYPNRKRMVASGLFKPALKVDGSSDIQTKLLALYGRDINWHP